MRLFEAPKKMQMMCDAEPDLTAGYNEQRERENNVKSCNRVSDAKYVQCWFKATVLPAESSGNL